MRRPCLARRVGGLTVSVIVVGWLGAGWLGAGANACAQPSTEVGEVVVTATKRESTLQDTPSSITVLGAETLQTTNADSFADIAKLTPSLTATDFGPGNKRYALRGLQSPGEPEVALYYDEIPISGLPGGSLDTGASQLDLKLIDINRVEVLRGPEGTLYGNGSEGGAVRIISNPPVFDRFEGLSEISGSGTDGGGPSFQANQTLNIPIVEDKFAVRIAAYYRNEGGWIDDKYNPSIALPQIDKNNLNSEKTYGVRASFGLKVNENWDITDIVYYQHLHTDNSFETYPGFASAGDPYTSKAFVRTPWDDRAYMDSLTSTYRTPLADIVLTGSYQYRAVDNAVDTSRYLLSMFGCTIYNWNRSCTGEQILPAAGVAHETVSAWSGEARVVSKAKGPLQWTIGTSLQDADDYRLSQVAQVDAQGYVQTDATGAVLNRIFARSNTDVFDQYSVFGNVSYEILPGLTFDTGLRWFHSYRSDQQVVIQQFFPGSPTGPEPFQSFGQGDLFKSFSLSYKVNPNALVYAEASQGFRAGGPNYPGGFTATAPPYGPDSVWDYETGLKLTADHGRLTWDTSVFWIDWSHLQVILPQANFSYISNAGSARSQGFESEVTAAIVQNLTTTAGVSFNNARLVGAQPTEADPTTQLRAGDRLAGVPEWTANVSLMDHQSLTPRYKLTERVDVTYESSRNSVVQPQNPAFFTSRPYTLVDLHFRLDREDGWGATLDVENLFNSYAELSVQPNDSNLVSTITAARPLTMTLGVSKAF